MAQVIWSNSHGLFVVGPFMAGCYCAAAAMRGVRGHDTALAPLTRLLAILLAATMITPYGADGWRYALLLFTEAGPHAPAALKAVGELSPTFGSAARAGYAFWFFALLLAATIAITLLQCYRRRIAAERLLIVVGLCAAALTGRRNIVLFALVAAPFTAEQLRHFLTVRPSRFKVPYLLATLVICGWAGYAQFGEYYLNLSTPQRIGFGASAAYFPGGLRDFLTRTGFRGQIYNSNSLGGFFLYQNYPQRLPLVDGRWEVYDPSVLDRINSAPANPLLWSWVVARYDIRGVLLQHASPEAQNLLPMIGRNRQWRLVYLDHAASFWMRSDCDDLPAAIDLTTPASLPPPSATIHATLTLGRFLQNVKAGTLSIINLRRALGFGKKTEFLLEQLGGELLGTGQTVEAEATFLRLNRQYPNNTTALNELSFMAASRGDMARAAALLQKALELDPKNPWYRANYERLRESANDRP
jgi:tetratricopeptide (TPR) repeat protein